MRLKLKISLDRKHRSVPNVLECSPLQTSTCFCDHLPLTKLHYLVKEVFVIVPYNPWIGQNCFLEDKGLVPAHFDISSTKPSFCTGSPRSDNVISDLLNQFSESFCVTLSNIQKGSSFQCHP